MSGIAIENHSRRIWVNAIAFAPVLLVASVIVCRGAFSNAWQFMWLLAFSLYASAKWYTWWQCRVESSWRRSIGYLLLWPGMNAEKFLAPSPAPSPPTSSQWLAALGRLSLGAIVLWGVLPWVSSFPAMVNAWIGMIGIALILHFGIFDLLAYAWRQNGVAADRLMNHPIRSISVSDYWGRRWNTAFRDLTNQHLFRPLSRRMSPVAAIAVAFFVSGVVHDVVISLPAGGGYGLPTIYFLLQAAAMVLERSDLGRRFQLMRGFNGWVFTAVAILVPAPLLFHAPFLSNVVLPMLHDIGALAK